MTNMSYCRFQNTLEDLRDCAEYILSGEDDDGEELSREEERARQHMIKLIRKLAVELEEQEAVSP